VGIYSQAAIGSYINPRNTGDTGKDRKKSILDSGALQLYLTTAADGKYFLFKPFNQTNSQTESNLVKGRK